VQPGETLLHYQALEQVAAALEAELAGLGRQLGGDGEVARIERALGQSKADYQATQLRLREIDREVSSYRDRMKSHEREMMSGRMRNPSDLTRMSTEVEHMKARISSQEDTELEVMVEAEKAEKQTRALESQLERASADAATKLADVEGRIPLVEEKLAVARSQAAAAWEVVPVEYQAAYRRLSRIPNPAAPVASGQCGGCHVSLTAAELQQVRRGDKIVNCQHCNRILVAV
jgi:hypothetical protein